MVPLSMTLSDLWPRFQGHDIFRRRIPLCNSKFKMRHFSDIRLQKNVVTLKLGSEVTQGHWTESTTLNLDVECWFGDRHVIKTRESETKTRPRPDRPRPRPGRPRPRPRPAWSRPTPTPETETFAVLVTTSTHKLFSFIDIWILHCTKCNNA